ncbi:hypothetical protein AMTR_s00050p00226020 [Amborella trichopoda]|uniref:Agenet-like domain-containing protein n=1 Tax=Amborella trichopoda TaxID=13333 RepID=W1PY23_AMBTC|nr:hypothetical protein AMTR_s00050p00226020 [Amborella trichopoda]
MIGKCKVMVEYDNIVSDDKKQPLIKITNIFNVRPLPPPRGFSVHEEVDAFCNDGWWAGVITKVKTKEFEEWKIDDVKCHGAKKAKKGGDNEGTKELEEENNSRKRERRSQLDMPDLTPTKEEAKKAKMGKDNGNIGMVV